MESGKTNDGAIPLDYSRLRHGLPPLYRRLVLMLIGLIAFVLVYGTVTKRRGDSSPRLKWQSNMMQIGLGTIMYASLNGGRFPDDLATLDATEDLPGACFVCPDTSTPPPRAPTTQAIANQLKKSGSTDYVYLGKGLTTASPPDTVLLYEPLSNHGGHGMNVLLVNGPVEWLSPAQAQVILKQASAGVRPVRYPRSTAPATRRAG